MRLTKTAVARTLASLGLVVFLIGIFGDGVLDWADIRAVGVASGICSLMWFFMTRARRDEDAIFQSGYDSGWLAGRRVARPVVVPALRELACPSREFGDELLLSRVPE